MLEMNTRVIICKKYSESVNHSDSQSVSQPVSLNGVGRQQISPNDYDIGGVDNDKAESLAPSAVHH